MKLIANLLATLINLATLLGVALAFCAAALTRDLPDHRALANWEPAVTTRLYAGDGAMIAQYARERRLFLPIGAMPARVKQAFLSAEDKNFYLHPGIDLTSLATALWSNVANYGSGRRMIGGSTITQQIAKNFLLSSDRTVERKLREAILSIRIDQTYSKDRILELYLNDIYLGSEAALYTAGLSVRTTLDPRLQQAAMQALRKGLVAYDQAKGYRGPLTRLPSLGGWRQALAKRQPLADVPEWRLAVVLSAAEDTAELGLRPVVTGASTADAPTVTIDRNDTAWALCRLTEGKRRCGSSLDGMLSPGDVVYVEKLEAGYVLRQPPQVQGALVSMDPNTGRVLAVAGGFSYAQSEFNRATQAYRQPGSSFKPFVYAAALDTGYAPTTLVMDAPIAIPDGTGKTWRPKNYDGRFSGPSTLRTGLENSRNLMTVRLARHLGMDLVADYGKRFGIYDELRTYLPMALGAGETTLLRLVSAYAVIANGGKAITPSMIDRVQDRYGRTIYRQDSRQCADCNALAWENQEEPVLADNRDYVLDPMTAFQITSMMRGVVERGTARNVATLGVPIAGKTGTTNDEKDVWFVGFTPNIVTGVFLGYDTPKPMGYGETGGGLAAPIFIDFMKVALQGKPAAEFHPPPGMVFQTVDKKTGRVAEDGAPGAIVEAFKPGTGPCEGNCTVIDDNEMAELPAGEADKGLTPQLRQKLLSNTGGLY